MNDSFGTKPNRGIPANNLPHLDFVESWKVFLGAPPFPLTNLASTPGLLPDCVNFFDVDIPSMFQHHIHIKHINLCLRSEWKSTDMVILG